jgi:hypothetical protein
VNGEDRRWWRDHISLVAEDVYEEMDQVIWLAEIKVMFALVADFCMIPLAYLFAADRKCD